MNGLRTTGLGPLDLNLSFAPRMNVITGDNGLGKSFVLDLCWWCLTESWAGEPAWPRSAAPAAEIHGDDGTPLGAFNRKRQVWERPRPKAELDSIVLYAQADGSMSLYDPLRAPSLGSQTAEGDVYLFRGETLWNGLLDGERVLCNGLLRDWVSWQQSGSPSFALLKKVLDHLSSPHETPLRPGPPTRLRTNDSRDVPTLEFDYGTVPLPHASSGIKRIVSLAYLIVWACQENRIAADLLGEAVTHKLVVLLDEAETHLHPQWQRHVLPALLSLPALLETHGTQTQYLVTTHSPLVLASLEPLFQGDLDAIFLFEEHEGTVSARSVPFEKEGDATGWLTSPIFGLDQARSLEAEKALRAVRQEAAQKSLTGQELDRIKDRLVPLLPEADPFWARWHALRSQAV